MILDAFARVEHRVLAAGHDRLHELRRRAERQRHLGGFDDAEPPAGPGADENQAAAGPKGAGDELDAVRDALALFVDGRNDFLVLLRHEIEDVENRHPVDPERRGVDGLCRQGLPLRVIRHVGAGESG